MIETELAVFVATFLAGMLAGTVASFLLALGRGSKAARAIFDFLTPLAVGALYFFALRRFASGVFRLYSLVAFSLGVFLSFRLLKRLSPLLLKILSRLKVPIRSLENAFSAGANRLLRPLRERRERRREERGRRREIDSASRRRERKRGAKT